MMHKLDIIKSNGILKKKTKSLKKIYIFFITKDAQVH